MPSLVLIVFSPIRYRFTKYNSPILYTIHNIFVCKYFCIFAGVIRNNLAGTDKFPFINNKPFQSYRPAGVYLIGADANFCAEAKVGISNVTTSKILFMRFPSPRPRMQ